MIHPHPRLRKAQYAIQCKLFVNANRVLIVRGAVSIRAHSGVAPHFRHSLFLPLSSKSVHVLSTLAARFSLSHSRPVRNLRLSGVPSCQSVRCCHSIAFPPLSQFFRQNGSQHLRRFGRSPSAPIGGINKALSVSLWDISWLSFFSERNLTAVNGTM
jgi:hypothetical protein